MVDLDDNTTNQHDPASLVERLKRGSRMNGDTCILWEAADEIERLRARVEELEFNASKNRHGISLLY